MTPSLAQLVGLACGREGGDERTWTALLNRAGYRTGTPEWQAGMKAAAAARKISDEQHARLNPCNASLIRKAIVD